MKNYHLMVIAGEASGDMRAAGLARALKQLQPSLRLSGIGGAHMRQAGVECFTDITELAVIGFVEVLKNLGRIKKVFDQALVQIDTTHPDAVILVDYPGFNLRLAREIKKRGIKIIYYISPQVWAWKEARVKKIKELVNRMIVLFPFEQETYTKYGMKVDYVGHPLVDEIVVSKTPSEVLRNIGLSEGKTTIGLMPGSRAKEVERHLPCMLEAAQKLFEQDHDRQFVLLKASTIPLKFIESVLMGRSLKRLLRPFGTRNDTALKDLPIKIYDGTTYDGINAMDAAMVASGTATLETALLLKPMVIIYKTSWLTYAIAKAVIKIPYIGLVNIVAGKKVAEELIQNDAKPETIARAVENALNNKQIVNELAAVKTSLGEPGASLRAAHIVLNELAY
ncbi:MAG: lipid-A-disaccharide synthase [Candidatus Omnitrophica bacterium]|nr:lipid-A-disaccharide synthase [Candidatus Omnitrophota bacterium]